MLVGEIWLIQADSRLAMTDTEAHECASWLASQHDQPAAVVLDGGPGFDSLEAVFWAWYSPVLRVRKRDDQFPGMTSRHIGAAIERAGAGVLRYLYFAKQGANLADRASDPERVLDSARMAPGQLFFLP